MQTKYFSYDGFCGLCVVEGMDFVVNCWSCFWSDRLVIWDNWPEKHVQLEAFLQPVFQVPGRLAFCGLFSSKLSHLHGRIWKLLWACLYQCWKWCLWLFSASTGQVVSMSCFCWVYVRGGLCCSSSVVLRLWDGHLEVCTELCPKVLQLVGSCTLCPWTDEFSS